jgi:2-amino-4-hydroxy-6-hydroxymethyldihydropteridine diphosphokinase
VLSIGSNLGERLGHLQGALDAVRTWLRAVSPVYETAPWGPVPQEDFLNAVLVVDDPGASARDWLARAQAAEQSAGRVRQQRWGPRTLDVDIICVDDEVSADPVLRLPHPRAAERAFVLVPWADVEPNAQLGGVPVRTLIEQLADDQVAGVRPRTDLVLR